MEGKTWGDVEREEGSTSSEPYPIEQQRAFAITDRRDYDAAHIRDDYPAHLGYTDEDRAKARAEYLNWSLRFEPTF